MVHLLEIRLRRGGRSLFILGALSLLVWGSSHSGNVAQQPNEALLLLQKCLRSGSPPDRVDLLIYDDKGNPYGNVSFGQGDFFPPKGGECAWVAQRLLYISGGTYSFGERLPDGWQFVSFGCVGSDGVPLAVTCAACRCVPGVECGCSPRSPTCSTSIPSGSHVICTFVNEPAGSGGGGNGPTLTVYKKAMGGDGKFIVKGDGISPITVITVGGQGSATVTIPEKGICLYEKDEYEQSKAVGGGSCTFVQSECSLRFLCGKMEERNIPAPATTCSGGIRGWSIDPTGIKIPADCFQFLGATCTYINECKGGSGGGGQDECMKNCLASCIRKDRKECEAECKKQCSQEPVKNPLSVKKTCTPPVVTIGSPVTCTITVTNSSDTPQSFQAVEQAPSGMELISASPADWVSLQNGQLIIRGSVGPRSSVTITLTFLVTGHGHLRNTVQVSGPDGPGGSGSEECREACEKCLCNKRDGCPDIEECKKCSECSSSPSSSSPVEDSSIVSSRGRPSTVGTAFIAASAIRTAGSTTAPPKVPKGVLLVDSESNQLRVYLSKGDGTFRRFKTYGTGERPVDVKAGDFDRDGKTDAVVVNSLSDSLTIYLGNGDGTFRKGREVKLPGVRPVAVAIADFDKDSLLDLAVAQNGSADLAILLGRGDGTFRSPLIVPLYLGNPTSISIADVDGDGSSDLIVTAIGTNEVVFFRGDGRGRFAEMGRREVGDYPVASTVGDFNQDGEMDVAVANLLSESVTFLLSRGRNRNLDFARMDMPVEQPMSLISGEFFTGIPGVAAPNFTSDSITFIGFREGRPHVVRRMRAIAEPVSLGLGDFNDDGLLDIVVAGLPVGNIATLLGRENGTFALKR